MSKFQVKQNIKHELRRINRVIDQKIIRGMPYTREARYHYVLLRRLITIRRTSILQRIFS